MVLKNWLGGIAVAAVAVMCGCVWVDDENPTEARLRPTDHVATLYPAYHWPVPPRLDIPTTREISAFVGTGSFRIAVIANEPDYHPNPWNFVLNPGHPDSVPRTVSYYPGGTYLRTDSRTGVETCHLSPDGNALVFSQALHPFPDGQPRTLWMQTLSGQDWLVPLASRANGSLGMLGKEPFWHIEGGRQFIVFAGLGAMDVSTGGVVQETRRVERLSDSTVSPVEPLRLDGAILSEHITGISRDNRWVLLRKHGGEYLIASERLRDSASMASPDSLRPATVGAGASLNPFPAAGAAHRDYYATLPFSIRSGKDSVLDTALSPRALDGKPGTHPDHAGSLWICDKDGNIVLSQPLPEGDGSPSKWVHWTSHPNFVLVERGGKVYLVKLAGDSQALMANPESSTLAAAGVFRLVSNQVERPMRVRDVSMWIGQGP